MFHAKAVAKWRGMIATAQEKLGGVQSGIGFLGSPGWVVTGSLVLGAIEGALSSASAKVGLKLLGEASEFLAEVHSRGVFVPVSELRGLDTPNPEAWTAFVEGINFMSLGEEFIRVRTADGAEIMVRWSGVSSYQPI